MIALIRRIVSFLATLWPLARNGKFIIGRTSDSLTKRLAEPTLFIFRRLVKKLDVNFLPGSLNFFLWLLVVHGADELDPKQLRANCLINLGGRFFDLQKRTVVRYAKLGH